MTDTKYINQTLKILDRVPLIDGHNDWPMYIRSHYGNRLDANFDEKADLTGHVDLKRLVKGRSGAVFWSAFMACPVLENDFSDQNHLEVARDTLQQIDLIHRIIERYSHRLELVQRVDDILPIFRNGKIASLIGVEGLHQIGNSSSILRNYHRLGVRYVTLAHNSNNLYADSATRPPIHGGLSESGKRMIQEMNRIGMMIDLSHVSEAVMFDALALSEAPVAFTHSPCFAVRQHPRNASDAVLEKLKANNGVIMITFVKRFIHATPENADVDHVVDHMVHAANLIGWDHVGIGSDFDGMDGAPRGLEDVSKFPNLVARMLARGIAPVDVEKVLGLNIIRVLKGVEKTAERLRGSPVLEDVIRQSDDGQVQK